MIGRAIAQTKEVVMEGWYPDPLFPFATPSMLAGGFLPSIERALGLPALLAVILRGAQGVSMVPFKVYRGDALDREPAGDTYQYELIHERPNSEAPAQAFQADITGSLLGAGYSCVRKFKVRGEVREMIPLDPRQYRPKRSGGRLVFEDTSGGDTLDQTDIIYIRGIALFGTPVGLSPITAARLGIHNGLKRQMFEARYFQKNAEPRLVLQAPEKMEEAEAQRWVDLWNSRHQGEENWHETSAIGGGFNVTPVPVSMADAQFVEANNMTGGQLGAIYGMPKAFLNLSDRPATDEDWRFFVTFGLGWVVNAIAQSLSMDVDLFPRQRDRSQRIFVEGVLNALMKPAIEKLYDAYRLARQAGWLTANEIRALENYPPLPGGDELQATPVGGAPNTTTPDGIAGLKLLLDEYGDDDAKIGILSLALERAGSNGHSREIAELLSR